MSKSAECFLKYKLKEENIHFTVLVIFILFFLSPVRMLYFYFFFLSSFFFFLSSRAYPRNTRVVVNEGT